MDFFRKFFGWILLFLGLAMIFYALYSSFNIFTAQTPAPEIFSAEEKEEATLGGSQILQDQIEKIIREQLKEILPKNSLSILLNLIAWSIFVGILIFAGAQISSLGIKLLK